MIVDGLEAAFLQQLRASRRGSNQVAVILLGVPQSLALGWLVGQSGSDDALFRVASGLALMAAWTASVLYLSWIVTDEVWSGTFELGIAAPMPVAVAAFGKAVALVGTGLLGGLLSAGVVLAVARDVPSVDSPLLAASALLVAAVIAVPSTAFAFAPLGALSPGLRAFTNGLIPVGIVLGGFLFPVSALPVWLEAAARVFPISWSTDALAGAASGWSVARCAGYLAASVGLAVVWLGGSMWLFARLERRFVERGSLPT